MTHLPRDPRPRLTDEDLDRLDVDHALDDLLDALMTTPEAARLATAEIPPRRRRPTWPVLAAAAAAVVAVAAVPAYLSRGDAPDPVAGPAASSTPSNATTGASATTGAAASTGPAVTEPDPWRGPSSYAVLDDPGWTIDPTVVNTDPNESVSIGYLRGSETFTLEWTAEKHYRGVLRSAEREGPSSTIEVLGEDATYFVYESQQQMAYLPVHDGYGLRIDAAFTTPEEFRALLEQLRVVDQAGLTKALPAEIVTPAETESTAQEMLAGMEVPDGFTRPDQAGFNGRYQLAYPLVSAVGCAWADQFVTARRQGDDGAQQQALDALAGSPRWPALADDVDWPDMYADTVRLMRSGGSDQRIQGAAGCSAPAAISSGATSLPDALADR